ncbi:MAG: SH3 domain-containing protein [Candidatus Roseilinea sp.]|uniref:SH3 domain-containing protein n=1 Tax=Candidatus Roseilinea sp. TaxID=2838777 RepID=UPI00404B392A
MNHCSFRALMAISLMAIVLPATPASATGAPGPGMNLLSNPGHEHPGVYFAGRGEINVTWSWVPFWQEPPPGADPRDQYYRTPEFRPVFATEYPDRVHSGNGSERWFNFWALNKQAGVMQEIRNLPVNAPLRFTTWAQLWSSNQTTQPPHSVEDGNAKIRVCIDQDGGPRDMTDPNLICSEWAQPYDKWAQISVDAVALNSTVLALIQSTAEIPVQHNDTYVDDSCFEILPAAGAKGICLGAGYVTSAIDAGLVGDIPAAPFPASSQTVQPASSSPPAAAAAAAPAGNTPKTAVNTAKLNVRDQPSLSGEVIGGLNQSDIVDVLGKSADGAWYQIQYDGKKAWIFASLTVPNAATRAVGVVSGGSSAAVSPAPSSRTTAERPLSVAAPTGRTPKTAVNADYLNVRDQPSLSGKIIGGLKRGDIADVLGRSADGAWYQIRYGGARAWIFASLTVPNAAARATGVVR